MKERKVYFMAYILAILGGYLMGCSNMAFWLARAKGVDLRSGGSDGITGRHNRDR